LSAFRFTTGDGLLSAKAFKLPNIGDVVSTLDEGNLVGTPGMLTNWDSIINRVVYHGDWNPTTKTFDSVLTINDLESQSDYGEIRVMNIKSKGLRSTIPNTDTFVVERAEARLERFRRGARVYIARAWMQKNISEVGDIVELSSRFLPNPTTGVRGVYGELVEVVNRRVILERGFVEYELMATGGVSAGIAEAGTLDYSFVTGLDRELSIFISDPSGEDVDGSPGYTVEPGFPDDE
jgi:hypothetical protein